MSADEWQESDEFDDVSNRQRTTYPWWGYPLLPLLWVLAIAAEVGQRATGDRPTGAFPSGCFGGIVGITGLIVLVITLVVFLTGAYR